jgi:hypothetical protein
LNNINLDSAGHVLRSAFKRAFSTALARHKSPMQGFGRPYFAIAQKFSALVRFAMKMRRLTNIAA